MVSPHTVHKKYILSKHQVKKKKDIAGGPAGDRVFNELYMMQPRKVLLLLACGCRLDRETKWQEQGDNGWMS